MTDVNEMDDKYWWLFKPQEVTRTLRTQHFEEKALGDTRAGSLRLLARSILAT